MEKQTQEFGEILDQCVKDSAELFQCTYEEVLDTPVFFDVALQVALETHKENRTA